MYREQYIDDEARIAIQILGRGTTDSSHVFGSNMPKRSRLAGLADLVAGEYLIPRRKPNFLDRLPAEDRASVLEVGKRWLNGQLGNNKTAVINAMIKHGVKGMTSSKFSILITHAQRELKNGQESQSRRRGRGHTSK